MRLTNHGHYYKTTSACEGNVALSRKSSGNDKPEHIRLPRIELGCGSLLDWFYHDLRVKYAYQIKLRDTGSYGFLLPKENIVPQGREMFNAVGYLGKYLMGQVGMDGSSSEAAEDSGRETPVKMPDVEDKGAGRTREAALEADSAVTDEGALGRPAQWELKRRRRR